VLRRLVREDVSGTVGGASRRGHRYDHLAALDGGPVRRCVRRRQAAGLQLAGHGVRRNRRERVLPGGAGVGAARVVGDDRDGMRRVPCRIQVAERLFGVSISSNLPSTSAAPAVLGAGVDAAGGADAGRWVAGSDDGGAPRCDRPRTGWASDESHAVSHAMSASLRALQASGRPVRLS
jgi:hypothetical protein